MNDTSRTELAPATITETAATTLPAHLSALRPAPPPAGARPRSHVETAIAITARQSATPIVIPDVKETVRRIDMTPEWTRRARRGIALKEETTG